VTDYRLFVATTGPDTSVTDGQPLNLAVEFTVSSQAWLTALHFWRADTTITGSITGQVFTAPGGSAVADTDATFSLSGTGWQTATLPAPVELTPGTRYRLAVHFPDRWCLTASYWSFGGAGENGITSGPLSALSAITAPAGQGSYAYGPAGTYPASASANHANYWVDVTVTDTDPGSGGLDEVSDETFGPGPLCTQWHTGRLDTSWCAGPLATSWRPGHLST
jgi:hypothetical protein